MKEDKKDEITLYALIIASFFTFGTIAYALIVGC
mgnify:FL=1